MTISSRIDATPVSHRRPAGPARIALAAIIVLSTVASARGAGAQAEAAASARSADRHHWELVASSGTLVPTGAQANALKRAPLTTAQLSWVVDRRFAVTTMVGWARSRDLVSAGQPRLSVFTYDVGGEVRADRRRLGSATVLPFAGAGAGGRSYDYRDRRSDATHDVAAYVAAGAEAGLGRARLRVEARDYVTGFRPVAGGGTSATRNDVAILAGLRFTRRSASSD